MEPSEIRAKLLEYVNNGDDNFIQVLYEAAVGYETDNDDHELTDEDLAILEERRNARITGESATYDWETAKAMITGRK